jgi:hypothetical protein
MMGHRDMEAPLAAVRAPQAHRPRLLECPTQ